MKRESLQEFLNNLTDREFSFFYKYRRKEFVDESLKKINSEFTNRNLTESQTTQLIKAKKRLTTENCPRCQSNNFLTIKETELRQTTYTAYEVEINSQRCRVCGYNPYKDKSINWNVRIRKWLGRYHCKRLL